MRIAFRLLLLLFVLLFVLVPDPCCLSAQPEESIYSGVSEALHDWRSERHGLLSEGATLFLLRELSLDWDYTEGLRIRNWDDVSVYGSANRQYFILVAAPACEWGQYGRAHYCLIDSAGHKYWERTVRITAPPHVYNLGTSALIYMDSDAHAAGLLRPVRIDFIGLDGDSVGSYRWDSRISRPIQRRSVDEHALFSLDGAFFVTTMNLSTGLEQSLPGELNNTSLFALHTDGSAAWEYYLGGFWPKSMEFVGEPESLCLNGEWRERIILNDSYDEGFIVFDLEGNLLEKTVTRHIDFSDYPE